MLSLWPGQPTQPTQPTKYATFWTWFSAHSQQLRAMRSGSEPIVDSLGAALTRVHPNLTFEIGPPGPRRELVLSADGIREAFPEVEALAAAAPKTLAGWQIIKFRPRRQPLNQLNVDRLSFDPKTIRFLLGKDQPGKVGILLFVPGYTEAQSSLFTQAGFLLLDEALGEYDTEMRVGAIELRAATDRDAARAKPLSELATSFDAYFARAPH